jgi:intein/homing endonuclease
MRKMSKRLSGILRSISTNPLLLNAGCKETNKIIKKGEGNPQNQESAVAKLLIDNGFKFIEKNKKGETGVDVSKEPLWFEFQPNGTQRSPDFIVSENGREFSFDLKSTKGNKFKWNDGFFSKVPNMIYIINYVVDKTPKIYIGLGEYSSTEEDRIVWEHIREKIKELHELEMVKNTKFLKIVVRQGSGGCCKQFTPEFTKKNFDAVMKFLE